MDKLDTGEPNPSKTIDVLKCLRCAHEGCTNVPGWGYDGEGPTLCSEHAVPVMVEVVALRCSKPTCSARRTFGFDHGTAELCASHKLDGMTDLMKRRTQCIVPNCTKLATYGFDGLLARFCFSHKSGGMMYLKNRKRCEYYECTRQPTYGLDGQRAKFCSSHKEEGMVDVKNCRCKQAGCTRQPNYGHEGGRAKYCSSHKLNTMVNVVSRRCEQPGCKRQPIYGFGGEKATFCPQHRMTAMIDVVNRHCEFTGCTKTPSYGYVGERAQYCSHHHLPDMEDVKNRRCEWHECRRYPIFGLEGERARFCSAHKTDDMVNVRNRRCEEGQCSKLPTHGFPGEKARACLSHTTHGMVNLKARKPNVAGMPIPKHEREKESRMLDAGMSLSGAGRQPGSEYGGDTRSMLGSLPAGGADDRSRIGGGYWGMGSRGSGGGGDLVGAPRESGYGGHGSQGPSPVMGWGDVRGVSRGGGGSGSGSGDASPTGVLSQQRKYGPPSHSDNQSIRFRRIVTQVDVEEQRHRQGMANEPQDLKQQSMRPLQSFQLRPPGHLSQGSPDDHFYGPDDYHTQSLQSAHSQQQMSMPSRTRGFPQGGSQMPRRSGSRDMPPHDTRPLHGYRDQHQGQEQQSRAYGNSSPYGFMQHVNSSHGYGSSVCDTEVSSAQSSGVLGGRAALRPPQARIPVAQPRARRPLPSSPERGVHGVSAGMFEGPLDGRQGNLSPFVGHQPSAHLRLPLPPVAPVMSGSFPPGFQPLEWDEAQGEGGGNSSGPGNGGGGNGSGGGGGGATGGGGGGPGGNDEGGGGGGAGSGGSGNAGAWNRDVGVSMCHVGHPHQQEEPMGVGGVAGSNVHGDDGHGGASAGSGSLVMDGAGGTNSGGFGARLSGVDLGPGLMPPFDRMQGMGDVRSASPGPFHSMGPEVSGGGVAGERSSISSPQGAMNDPTGVGVSARPLSPLMTALGDSGESPPGLPRLRTLNNRSQDSHGGTSYSPQYLPTSSAPLSSSNLAGIHQDMPPSAVSTGHNRASATYEPLAGQEGEGMMGAADGRHSSRDTLEAQADLHRHESGRVEDGWVSPGVVGESGTLEQDAVGTDGGEGAQDEGDDEDPRKHLRIEELLH